MKLVGVKLELALLLDINELFTSPLFDENLYFPTLLLLLLVVVLVLLVVFNWSVEFLLQ
jgi:hypothetical protein